MEVNVIFRFSRWIFLLCAVAMAAPSQVFTTLVDFNGTNGSAPDAALIEGFGGQLYGTTYSGGTSNAGTIFRVSPQGAFTSLFSLSSPDGVNPEAALLLAPNRLLYGVASAGGATGNGTVFQITPEGTLTVLHTFDLTDGAWPIGLVQAFNGTLYGTTYRGGTQQNGTIFKITPGGALTTMHNFGAGYYFSPFAAPVQASNGLLYGTTFYGGAYGGGAIYTISLGGAFTTICSFSGGPDGAAPADALVQGNDGNLYGTTEFGGLSSNVGTVFQITPAGVLTTLHAFGNTDGARPQAGLVQGTDGNFYGTTQAGSTGDWGTVFRITPSGTLTTLHRFALVDGEEPLGGLVQHTDGAFYGTTTSGGSSGNGTIYRLSVGLGPFVKTLPAFGTAGTTVTIMGSNFTGATSVTFNGIAAAFTVLASYEITATVPAGATTGTVQVVTPSGTLSSNTAYQVLP